MKNADVEESKKSLIVGTWQFYGFTEIKDPPYIEGPLPEFMVFIRDEFYQEPTIHIMGTNSSKIEMFKKVLGWYWPKTEKEAFELLRDLEGYHTKSLTIQWYDDFMERLKKNHINLVDGDMEDNANIPDHTNIPVGTLLFRKQPADLKKLGVKKTSLEPGKNNIDSGPAFGGKVFVISDGTTEIYWKWDDHWCYGAWRLRT